MRGRIRGIITALALSLGLVAATAGSASAVMVLSDNFSGYPVGVWEEGTTHGPWTVDYDGYGTVQVLQDVGGSKYLSVEPQAVTSPDETSAAMVLSTSITRPRQVYAEYSTVAQLRQGIPPNPWETGWLVWNHWSDEQFYYLALKPNGWELGKADDTKADPNGPACDWPEYVNCRYEGAQRYLATSGSPQYPIGSWNAVRVTLSYPTTTSTRMTVAVSSNGGTWTTLATYTDTVNALRSGQIGLYTEDARVRYGYVQVDTAG